MSPTLEGIVVVSIEQAISAPFASRQLADLGATVIKVERTDGDFARHYDQLVKGNSAFFVWANRGKESLALDLTKTEDSELLASLIAGADVVLHNVSPEAARRRGLDAPTLRATRPELIVCAISGYGEGGPRSEDKAYDLAIQAEAGAFSVTGDEEMSKVGFSVADIASGMYALTSILAALVRRDRTGEGADIQVSMLEALSERLSAPMCQLAGEGREVKPSVWADAATRAVPYLPASLRDFWLQLPVSTKSMAPPCDRFKGTMAFAARPPPCMNKILNCAGTARSSRRSASACS